MYGTYRTSAEFIIYTMKVNGTGVTKLTDTGYHNHRGDLTEQRSNSLSLWQLHMLRNSMAATLGI